MQGRKLAGFIIDCQTDDLLPAATFWGRALGMPVRQLPADEGEKYVALVDPREQLHIEVQAVAHESRIHLDIETDNINAEVVRLEALGAIRGKRIHTWWVQAPTGQRFCVVRAKSTPSEFAAHATEWR